MAFWHPAKEGEKIVLQESNGRGNMSRRFILYLDDLHNEFDVVQGQVKTFENGLILTDTMREMYARCLAGTAVAMVKNGKDTDEATEFVMQQCCDLTNDSITVFKSIISELKQERKHGTPSDSD